MCYVFIFIIYNLFIAKFLYSNQSVTSWSLGEVHTIIVTQNCLPPFSSSVAANFLLGLYEDWGY
jgi:hypothetical protein